MFDGPRSVKTDEPTLVVSGRIHGGEVMTLVLRVNGGARRLPADARKFSSVVSLEPGLNRITASAVGRAGLEAEDTITVLYSPKVRASRISLSSPPDGLTLGPDDPPAVVVEGEVEDPSVSVVWLVVNQLETAVPVYNGRFRYVVPVLEPRVSLWAESRSTDGSSYRSNTVSLAAPGMSPVGLLILHWPGGLPTVPVEVGATWRGEPGRLDGAPVPVHLRLLRASPGAGAPEAAYVRNPQPGAYTFTVHLGAAGPTVRVRPTVYASGSGAPMERRLGVVPVDGKGRAVVARILLPQGILWDDDGWTGKSESVDAITKFRFPEGITWTERKADLP